jgi:ABC-type sugar transport system permease subunit
MGYYLYDAAFNSLQYGYASALAWIIALASGALAVFYRRITITTEETSP